MQGGYSACEQREMKEMVGTRQGETAWCFAMSVCSVQVEKAGRDFIMQGYGSALVLLITSHQLGAEAFFSSIQGPISSPCLPALASLSLPPPWLLRWKISLIFPAIEEWMAELRAEWRWGGIESSSVHHHPCPKIAHWLLWVAPLPQTYRPSLLHHMVERLWWCQGKINRSKITCPFASA